jgi:hypothetical protein
MNAGAQKMRHSLTVPAGVGVDRAQNALRQRNVDQRGIIAELGRASILASASNCNAASAVPIERNLGKYWFSVVTGCNPQCRMLQSGRHRDHCDSQCASGASVCFS